MINREGQVAIVTGGSQGMGLATVTALAERKLTVAALARDPGRLEAALKSLDPFIRGRVIAVAADVSREDEVESAVLKIAERFGRLDVLVNSAGVGMNARTRLEDTATEEWRRLIDTNLTGTYLMCRTALPHLKVNGGYILNVLSTGAYRVREGMSLYAASKFGARALTEGLIEEFRDTGVRTTSVSPGPVDTAIWNHKLEPPTSEERARMMRPTDISDILLWLLDRPNWLHIPNITVTPWV